MKAIIWTKYGSPDVLQLQDVAKPVPQANELLIKIHAATVTAGDCELRSFKNPSVLMVPMRFYVGLLRPKRLTILGQEIAGEVVGVGPDVILYKEGDLVFASTGFRLGGYAEYVCLAEDGMIARKPTNMTMAEATAVPLGGLEAWQYLKRADMEPGQTALINGAGGSIGTMAIQLAKHFGMQVTAVDSTDKLEMLRNIGADDVIDYTQEDFTRNGQTYDLIFDVVGKSPLSRSQGSLTANGRYFTANPGTADQLRGLWPLITRRQQVVETYTSRRNETLLFLKELIEAGEIRAVIDKQFPLAETAAAHRYVESGRKKGNVVITIV